MKTMDGKSGTKPVTDIDGPTGEPKVAVTFAPTGKVSRVDLTEPYQRTKVGECMEAVFLALTVPPFAGKPVRLTKTIELAR